VSADGVRWFLLNASPDVREQLPRLQTQVPTGLRHVPVEGIAVTDAELDHSLGITLLREARRLQLYATGSVLKVLAEDSRILPVTEAFAEVAVTTLPLGEPTPLRYAAGEESGLSVTPVAVAGDPPRFARQAGVGHTVGFWLTDRATGGTAAFVPGCGALDPPLLRRLAGANLVLFDGTFWTDDEMVQLGLSERTARQMDHLPVSGPGGSLEALADLPGRHRVYTHINNSNPMLIEDSPARRAVEAAGLVVGMDGMRFTI
jgi:pyrroloquinoline quinone biosynthesis protein B